MTKDDLQSSRSSQTHDSGRLSSLSSPGSTIAKDVNILPQGAKLPKWKDLPLNNKFPMIPAPSGTYTLCTTKVGNSKYVSMPHQPFDISPLVPFEYNALHDRHLKRFLKRDDIRKCLLNQGLITSNGKVKCDIKEFNKFREFRYQQELLSKQNRGAKKANLFPTCCSHNGREGKSEVKYQRLAQETRDSNKGLPTKSDATSHEHLHGMKTTMRSSDEILKRIQNKDEASKQRRELLEKSRREGRKLLLEKSWEKRRQNQLRERTQGSLEKGEGCHHGDRETASRYRKRYDEDSFMRCYVKGPDGWRLTFIDS